MIYKTHKIELKKREIGLEDLQKMSDDDLINLMEDIKKEAENALAICLLHQLRDAVEKEVQKAAPHWEDSPSGNPDFKFCSECKTIVHIGINEFFTYCPYCGVKMK